MIARLLALVLCLVPSVFALDFDTLDYNDIEDVTIKWDTVNTINPSMINRGASTSFEIAEYPDMKMRGLMRFSTTGLAKVPDTNAVVWARLYFKSTAFSVPFYLKAYALYNDKTFDEGLKTGASLYEYGHEGVSWISPHQPPYPDTMTGTLPSRYDARDSNYASTVLNQGGCGCCWAFGIVGQVEAVYKKALQNWTTTYNSEDGTGADRTAEALLSPSPEVTGTGWEARPIPAWLLDRWYRQSGTDNGLIYMADSGDVKINSTEAGSNDPRLYLKCVSRNTTTGIYSEPSIQIKGTTKLFDTYINSGATTTNYGGADSARINASCKYLIRCDSFRAVVNTALASLGDTVVQFYSGVESVYVSAVYHNSTVRAHGVLKSKFVEGEATNEIYKTSYEWGQSGANKVDQIDLSEQQLLSCVPNVDCSDGGSYKDTWTWAQQESLVVEEASRYQGNDAIACIDTFGTANAAIVKWIWRVAGNSQRILKQAIMVQPLSVTVGWNTDFVSYVWSSSNTCWYGSTYTLTHAVDLIGWDDADTCDLDGGIGTWLVRNQYGYTWGQDGYAYVSRNGDTDFSGFQGAGSGGNASYLISLTANVPHWDVPGIIGGTEITSQPAAQSATITANGWNYIDLPAYMIRAMINGNMSRSILLQAESSASTGQSSGIILRSTEYTTAADRPYLVLISAPQSQVATKLGNVKIGNTKVGR